MNQISGKLLGSYKGGRATALRSRRIALERYYKKPSVCLFCKKVIKPLDHRPPSTAKGKKFCNSSCSAAHSNRRRKRKRQRLPKCLMCKVVKVKRSQSKFCSFECSIQYKYKKNKPLFLLGRVSHQTAKRHLKRIAKERCSICKRTRWGRSKIPLILDHKNGNPEDNRIKNLRLVCGNCDMLLPTYKSKNRGNGRFYRRQRYKDGKSF